MPVRRLALPWHIIHQRIVLLFWFFLMSESVDDDHDDDDDIIFFFVQPSFESWFSHILCFPFVSCFLLLFYFFLFNTSKFVVVFDMGSRLCARCLAMQIEWLLRWYHLFMLIFTFFNNQKKLRLRKEWYCARICSAQHNATQWNGIEWNETWYMRS